MKIDSSYNCINNEQGLKKADLLFLLKGILIQIGGGI